MTNAIAEYQQSTKFTQKDESYARATKLELAFIADLAKMPFHKKSFLDEGFLDEKDGLPLGARIAISPKLNPDKLNSPYPIDLGLDFLQETNGDWKKLNTNYLGDLKERYEPRYLIHLAYKEWRKKYPNMPIYRFFETVGLDEGNEKRGREYATYLKKYLSTGIDVWLLYIINYDKDAPPRYFRGEKYQFPDTNQSLYLTSVRRVHEAEKANLIVKTPCTRNKGTSKEYKEDVNQLPFPLILPSGKPLFQKVMCDYVLKV